MANQGKLEYVQADDVQAAFSRIDHIGVLSNLQVSEHQINQTQFRTYSYLLNQHPLMHKMLSYKAHYEQEKYLELLGRGQLNHTRCYQDLKLHNNHLLHVAHLESLLHLQHQNSNNQQSK